MSGMEHVNFFPEMTRVNTLRTGSFKLFKRPLPGFFFNNFNPLNAELNPICYLLALLAHHFLYVSRIRVKSLKLLRNPGKGRLNNLNDPSRPHCVNNIQFIQITKLYSRRLS